MSEAVPEPQERAPATPAPVATAPEAVSAVPAAEQPDQAPARLLRPSLAAWIKALRPTTALVVGGVAGATLVSVAWAVTAIDFGGRPQTISTTGSLLLTDPSGYTTHGTSCAGNGGYGDIDAGTEVTVTDASGTVIAADHLTAGEVVSDSCMFGFTVHDIPAGSTFYRVEVSHRGALTETEAELRKGGLVFTLGS